MSKPPPGPGLESVPCESPFTGALLDTADLLVLVLDPEQRVLRFNPECERVSGHGAAEVLGRQIAAVVIPEEERADVEAVMARLRAGERCVRHENHWLHRDGSRRLIAWNNTALRGPDGAIQYLIATGVDITAQRQLEQALREEQERLREITAVLADGVYVVDAQGVINFANPAAAAMLGRSEAEMLGRPAHALFHGDGGLNHEADCPMLKVLQTGTVQRSHEDYFLRRDGSRQPVALAAAPILRGGKVVGAVTAFHDISTRLTSEQALRDSEERFRMLFNSGNDAVFVHGITPDGHLTKLWEVNDRACEHLGYSREELLAMYPNEVDDPESLGDQPEVLDRLRRDGHATFERVHVARDGRHIPVEMNTRIFRYRGAPMVISVARDISERKAAEERIRALAHYDQLTGLPNRVTLMDRLAHGLERAKREHSDMAVLFVDLDGFKEVNDQYGHETGDHLLQEVATRIRHCLRKSDTVARFGGDEFVVLLEQIEAAHHAVAVAEKIRQALAVPVVLKNRELHTAASIGIAYYPTDGRTVSTLLRHADKAMYRAKAEGEHRYALYRG